MDQRTYRGVLSASELADFLVQRYDPLHNIQAQRFGDGDSVLVQVGLGEQPAKIRHAVTVTIAATKDGDPGLVVTMGQRRWITPDEATHVAFWGLLAVLITPWVLFALIWPFSEMLSASSLPGEIWDAIDAFTIGAGAHISESVTLTHPHLER